VLYNLLLYTVSSSVLLELLGLHKFLILLLGLCLLLEMWMMLLLSWSDLSTSIYLRWRLMVGFEGLKLDRVVEQVIHIRIVMVEHIDL
jgi:hypothetical protein